MEEPRTRPQKLLKQAQYYIDQHNKLLDKLGTFADNRAPFPRMQQLQLSKAMLLIMPRQRWHRIIQLMFDGMDPPVVKQEGTGFYLNIVIPHDQMTPEQRKRIAEIKHNTHETIWSFLSMEEMVWICGSIQGMCINLQNMYYVMRNTIDENAEEIQDNAENNRKRERS